MGVTEIRKAFFDESCYGPEYLHLLEKDGERWLELRMPEAGTLSLDRKATETEVLEQVQDLREQADALEQLVELL